MNYRKLHDAIVSRAKNRKKPDCYCEKHHIIPKSMGGSDDKTNIVILTAREHFLIHWLLFKIHNNKSMRYAFFAMTKPVGNGRTRYNSASFAVARKAMAEYMKKNMSGKNHPLYGVKGKDNPHYGLKRSEETKKKISISAKNRDNSNHHMLRAVICVQTGEEFKSLSDARKKYPSGNISYSVRTGGKAGGLNFKYKKNPVDCKLKGYASGESHPHAKKVIDENGVIYNSTVEAGLSVNSTGSAIRAAISEKRRCKGVLFRYV